MDDKPEVASPPVGDLWKAEARRLGEKARAAAAAKTEADAAYAKSEAVARRQAERGAEQDRERINGFLTRMHDAGDRGCGDHDLSISPTHYQASQGHTGATMRGDDPYDLVVRGWVIESRTTSHEARSDWHDPPASTTYERTVLTVDGIAYYAKSSSRAPIYERHRVKPEDVTLEMLVRTLMQNGVEV